MLLCSAYMQVPWFGNLTTLGSKENLFYCNALFQKQIYTKKPCIFFMHLCIAISYTVNERGRSPLSKTRYYKHTPSSPIFFGLSKSQSTKDVYINLKALSNKQHHCQENISESTLVNRPRGSQHCAFVEC